VTNTRTRPANHPNRTRANSPRPAFAEGGSPITRVPARTIPTLVASGSLLARGRLTGIYER
jgi:hypothetical protein